MQIDANSVEEYLEKIPKARKEPLKQLRKPSLKIFQRDLWKR